LAKSISVVSTSQSARPGKKTHYHQRYLGYLQGVGKRRFY